MKFALWAVLTDCTGFLQSQQFLKSVCEEWSVMADLCDYVFMPLKLLVVVFVHGVLTRAPRGSQEI